MGPGQIRYYMVPAGLVRVEEVQEGWGLVEVRGRTVKVLLEPKYEFRIGRCRYELTTLVAFARRVQLGFEPTVGCLAPKGQEP